MAEQPGELQRPRSWQNPLIWIVLAGAALRLHHLGRLSIWYDESTTMIGARFVDASFAFLSAGESRLVPLYSVMTKLWQVIGFDVLGVTQGSEFGDAYLRFLPWIFSVALIPLTYELCRYLFNRPLAGWIAAAGVAVSPLHIFYAQEYRPHSAYAFLVTLGVYCSLRALDEGRLKWWVGTVLCGILSVYTYYFSAIYLVCMNFFALSGYQKYKGRIVPWSISQIAIALAVIPPGLMAMTSWSMHSNADAHWFPHPTLKMLLYTVKNYFVGYSPNLPMYYAAFGIVAILISLGVYSVRTDRLKLSLLFFASFAPVLLQILLWSTQEFAFFTYRIQLAFSAPVYILFGLGISYLSRLWMRGIVCAALLVMTGFALDDYYAQRIHPAWAHVIGARYKIDNRDAASWIREQWQDGDAVAHFCTLTLPPFREHYLQEPEQWMVSLDEKVIRELLASYPDEKMWETIGFLPRSGESIVQEFDRVWYVESWWEYGQHIPRLDEYRDWFDAHGELLETREFDGITVRLYATPGAE